MRRNMFGFRFTRDVLQFWASLPIGFSAGNRYDMRYLSRFSGVFFVYKLFCRDYLRRCNKWRWQSELQYVPIWGTWAAKSGDG